MQVQFVDSIEIAGEQFFADAERISSVSPSGWLDGTRHDVLYGADEEVAPRALVYEGISGGILPFRGMFANVETGEPRFPTKTVDVGVFDKASSRRTFDARIYDRFGPVRLPLFEMRAKRVLRKAQEVAGGLAVAGKVAE